MSHPRRWAVALTLSALFLAACQQKSEKKPDPAAPVMPSFADKKPGEGDKPADKPADKPGSAEMPAAGDQPVVRLLAPGAEPRKLLRFHMKPGDKQRVAMHMKMAMDMDIAGQAQKVDMPTMTMILDVTAKSVAANGDMDYEFVTSDVTIADDGGTPGMKAALEGVLSSAKGMSGKGTISNRGFNKGAELSLPPNANAQLAQTMGQMKDAISQIAAPVPEEPVGVGGKWEVRMAIKQQSIVIKQIGTYEVTSIDGDRIATKTTVAQSADPQPVSNPQMPSLKMELVRMTGGGEGETTIDLTKGMPAKASADLANEMEMSVDANGQKQALVMKMKIGLKIEEK